MQTNINNYFIIMDKTVSQQAQRTIQFFQAQGQTLKTIVTDITTQKELVELLDRQYGISTAGLSLIDGGTNPVEYSQPNSILPVGDCTIFAMPSKQKLGAEEYPESTKYFAVVRAAKQRIEAGLCTKEDFGGLGAKNLDNIIAVLKKQDAKSGNAPKKVSVTGTGKKLTAGQKAALTRATNAAKKNAKKSGVVNTPKKATSSLVTKNSVLKQCRAKLKSFGLDNNHSLIKDINIVLETNSPQQFVSDSLAGASMEAFRKKAEELRKGNSKLR